MNVRQLSISFEALLDEFDTHRIAREHLLAKGTNCRDADLSQWANKNHPRTPPLLVVHILEKECGKPIVSRAMAAEVLGVPPESYSLAVTASKAVQSAAKAGATVAEADEDGVITPNEETMCLPEIDHAIEQLKALRRGVVAKSETQTLAAE